MTMVFDYKKIISLICICLGIICFTSFASAQLSTDVIPDDLDGESSYGFDTGPNENDVLVDTNPQYPGAFENVALRTSSDYIDLNRYYHAWFVDGVQVLAGIGERSVVVKTKGYGQRTTVVILIQLADTLIKKSFYFEPQDATLVWEAYDSYVPPFYQGKKLPTREGVIKAVAIPNFKNGNKTSVRPEDAVYRWSRNENNIPEANGYGRDAFFFKNNKSRSTETIRVSVSNTDNTSEAIASMTIPLYNPKILFYEKNLATGIVSSFSKKGLGLNAPETTVIAEPFFFSAYTNPSSLNFQWELNKQPISIADSKNKNSITLKNPGGSGTSEIQLGITNPQTLFQSASALLPIVFTNK